MFFVSVFVFSSFNLLLPFPSLTRISHRSCPVLFVRGWVWILLCVGVTAGFQHPTDIHRSFLKSLFYKKKSNTHTEKKSVWLYWSFVVLLLFGRGKKKTTCMTRQCFQSCCIYPLWIHCECTVLYLTITGIYMVLRVCRWQLTHIKYTQSPINSPTL